MDADLLVRVTPPERERRVVAVLRRLDNGQNHIIDESEFRIGREKRCDLIIPDPSVSRLHAEISFKGGHYLWRDLGRHATRVNGRDVPAVHKLRAGDKLEVGSYQFVFSLRPASAEEFKRPEDLTPVRSAVPDAPTLQQAEAGSRGGRALSWLIVLVIVAGAAYLLLA